MLGARRVTEVELAALDFETTGLSPSSDRVIEVAVVRGRLGRRPSCWSTLVDPDRPVDATWVHGIDDAMVRGQPRFPEVCARLCAELHGAVLVAHNATFDLSFLEMECARTGRALPPLPVLDTLSIARRNYRFPSNSLAGLCARFGVERERAHRAADDARATFALLGRMLADLDPEGELDVDSLRALRRPPDHVERVRARLYAAWKAEEVVEIEYDAQLARTRRQIKVSALERSTVRAWCHLRAAEREFALERIRRVEDAT